MSFADYGLDVFLASSRQRTNLFKSCGDCCPIGGVGGCANVAGSTSSCCRQIVEHLIELGVWAENELLLVKSELEKYKRLELTAAQIDRLRFLSSEQENSDKLNGNTRLEDVRAFIIEYLSEKFSKVSKNLKNVSDDICKHDACCINNLQKLESDTSSDPKKSFESFSSNFTSSRTSVLQKDSEIISLKNDNAEKDAELQQLEKQNKKLEIILDKMKDDIEILESSSRISQAQIQDVILQKNQEVEILKKNIEKLEFDLKDERQVRKSDEREMQFLVREAQNSHKNLVEELKLARRRVEAVEASKTSQEVMVRQLQQERDNLDKQSREQENVIDKLLKMIERLNDKYKLAQTDLSGMRQELEAREQRLGQCREQLECMEREVGGLIAELAACLGEEEEEKEVVELDSPAAEENRTGEQLCARARQLGRGLDKLAREHAQCQERRARLLGEIERLGRGQRAPEGLERLEHQAGRELARLERLVLGADNYRALKEEMKSIVDEVLARLDSRRIEKVEEAYINVADEASLTLEKLDRSIGEHEDYRACERYLILELKNLQSALENAQNIVTNLGSNVSTQQLNTDSPDKESQDKLDKALEKDYPVVSILSKKILQQVQNSTRIVIGITSALREDKLSKELRSKETMNQLQQALSDLDKTNSEKEQLLHECDEYRKQTKELIYEVERLRSLLKDKANQLQDLSHQSQSRLDSRAKENETLRLQVTIVEKKFLDSRNENTALLKKSSEISSKLKKELESKELKLKEYCKLNDFLNCKLEESNKMIKQLQSSIVLENARKTELDSFAALHARLLELVGEKDGLIQKVDGMHGQLSELEASNRKLLDDLAKMHRDNEYLEKCVKEFRSENQRLEANLAKENYINTNLGSKCEAIIGKVIEFSRQSFKLNLAGDAGASELRKQLAIQADKLRSYQMELNAKEQEVREKNMEIEQLTEQIRKARAEHSLDNSTDLMKRLEVLTREKSELKNELKQTSVKYEDKLSEMHKQYKHNEVELHKKHTEIIRRLEAKYLEMMKEEGKVYGSSNWLQSLNPKELRDLHDRICKSQSCFNRPCERDVYEEQKKKMEMKSARQLSASKKADRSLKSSNANLTTKPSSRQRTSVKDILYSRSVIIPEKEFSSSPIKSASLNKSK